MSTTTHYGDAFELYPRASRSPRPRLAKLLASLRTTWEALGEGFAASSRYRELTGRGIPPEQAASKVFFEHFSNR